MPEKIIRRKHRLRLSSFQTITLGFAGVILLGALLLMLPVSSVSGTQTPFHEALFTSVSAVCVTGLVVQDTASYWSSFGQAVILLLILIAMRCVSIARVAKDTAGMVIAAGMGALIGIQGFMNIAVATMMMPNTGLPLPFVSYGLSSLVSMYIGIGFVLNVGLQRKNLYNL